MENYKHIFDRIFERLEKSLNPDLTYHNVEHTLMVMEWAEELARREGVTDREFVLIQVAALFHDTGFLVSREEHEKRSCEIARKELADEDFTAEEIDLICGMIMATKIPQTPTNHLDRILVDADLYYLGTNNYNKYATQLHDELKSFNSELSNEEWKNIQIKFLENHHYTTDFAKSNLEPRKLEQLKIIKRS
ncbi:MAG TPA: HD domain-containing protein [Cryomorphaceae bacterium]|nr:HD domain-containing protein [Cryomorphaceae bacterium]